MPISQMIQTLPLNPLCILENSVPITLVILPTYSVQAPEAIGVHTVNCDIL